MAVKNIGKSNWEARGKFKMPDGTYKDYRRKGFKTKAAAEEFERNLKDQGKLGVAVAKSQITFSVLTEMYLKSIKGKKKTSTIVDDEITFKKINSDIGEEKIIGLNKIKLEEYFKSLDDKGYALNYIDKIYFCVRKALVFAKKEHLIVYNVMDDVDRIKRLDEVKDEIKFWTPDDLKQFLSAVDNATLKDFYEFLYWTGLRRGEALGVTWEKINFTDRTLRINQQISVKLGEDVITSPKTKNSIRTLKMPEVIYNMMKQRYEEAKKLNGFNEKFFIFGNDVPLKRNYIQKNLDKYIIKAGVKTRITIHGFRHSCASYLINNGCNILAVAKYLGDTVDTLTSTYAHLFTNTQDELIAAIDQKNKKED
ncbi:tyrosine-type recombinase/integrase [Holdemania massiliensis]|uniref:tyrosine-type recombinase/integrase n=1 Tax=Holdemania massiliensis TaxID=1468449 RepID=UPI00242ED5A0|nr:site-specific integrase [Holdemania massiliensis]